MPTGKGHDYEFLGVSFFLRSATLPGGGDRERERERERESLARPGNEELAHHQNGERSTEVEGDQREREREERRVRMS